MKRGRRNKVILGVIGLIVLVSGVRYAPSLTRQTPPQQPRQAVTSHVEVTPAPSPRPERKPHTPTSTSLTIYVVSLVNDKFWGVSATMLGWKMAKYTDFKPAKVCPLAAPCIKIYESKLPYDIAAQATFTYSWYMYIELNPLVTTHSEAQSALGHEFGHLLGAPHIVGTMDTIMSPSGVYHLLPTKRDIAVVDGLGRWQLEKMYVESGKTVDVRSAPK